MARSYIIELQVTKYKAIFSEGIVATWSLYGNTKAHNTYSRFSNKSPRNIAYYFSEVGGGLRSWKGCLVYSLILSPSFYWQVIRMVYRLPPHFKAYLLMFWDIYPIKRNSRDLISTLNYILPIFGREWPILMGKLYPSEQLQRKGGDLYILSESSMHLYSPMDLVS